MRDRGPAAPRKSGGPLKQRVLFDLVRSRAAVHAALRGMTPEVAARPMGAGKWDVRLTVLHLCARDRARLREMERTLRGIRPSWADYDPTDWKRVNARDLGPLRHVGWREALTLMKATRRDLLEAIESVPEEPAEQWTESHPFGWMLRGLPPHDRHHAEVIRRWRAKEKV